MVNLDVKDQEHAGSPNTLKEILDSKILKEKLVDKRKSKSGYNSDFREKTVPYTTSLRTYLCLGDLWSVEETKSCR